MNKYLIAMLALIWTVSWSDELRAQETKEEQDTYAQFYSKGMQAYVDGDYGQAIDFFYRAYGMKPKPVVARLIVRSLDFRGACDAARRQQEFYRAEHPGQKNVELQQCSNPARVEFECGEVEAPVLVDDEIEGRCGETLALAPGAHVVTSPALDSPARLDVEAGEERSVSLAVDPKKWTPPTGDDRPRKWGDRRAASGDGEASAGHGDVDPEDFSVYQSRDGIYRVWVRYDLLKDPDMHSGDDEQPRVLRLCDVDQTYDDAEENCVPLEPLQIEKVE